MKVVSGVSRNKRLMEKVLSNFNLGLAILKKNGTVEKILEEGSIRQ